jgi:serine/threonine-protein kinase
MNTNMSESSKESGKTSLDSIFGKVVVDKKLCTKGEVDNCLDIAKKRVSKGQPTTLTDVLLSQGYLTKSQFKRLKSEVEQSRSTQQIPGFQMIKKLGQGAMAVVFMAKQISLDRTVAIKVLPKRLSENPEYVERFYKEGRAAAMLNHNNIVQAFDVGESGGTHYFVMEYVEGLTVYDVVKQKGVYAEKEALLIISQMADALHHAHEKGLIHRDVKPKNIMITSEGVAKLADMGLARELTDTDAAESEQGRAYGTPYYIAPEQIRGEIDIDYRADIYSLGATLYHMVTGRVPFEAPSPSAVMHKHLKEDLVPPDHLNSKLSVGVSEVVEIMMAKKRDERYLSAQELSEDLKAVANGEPPMQARQRFDADTLSDLEKGEEDYDAYEEHEQINYSNPVGLKMTVMLLSGALLVSILIIFMLFSGKS